eukprot:139905-Hanusia_phi.AAC.1
MYCRQCIAGLEAGVSGPNPDRPRSHSWHWRHRQFQTFCAQSMALVKGAQRYGDLLQPKRQEVVSQLVHHVL